MFQVMTMNISGYADRYGPWGVRRELIRQAVHDTHPDVLALQAVHLDPALEQSRDQAAQMARIMPQFSSMVFQAANSHPDGKIDGLAVLSRFGILESEALKFTTIPGLEDQSQRTILRTRLETPDGTIELFNVTFSWVAEQAMKNVTEALAFVGRFQGPRMLVGDLNQTPDSAAIAVLVKAGWIDAWAQCNPDKKGFTFVENGKFVKRIDYIWLDPGLAGRLESIRLTANTASTLDDRRGSDHAALLASFR